MRYADGSAPAAGATAVAAEVVIHALAAVKIVVASASHEYVNTVTAKHIIVVITTIKIS
ncbi:hypothetical protein JQ575_36565 [Bradyrhizobium sp. JYMT SZCCT0428]|nr:hypothetical protein [Bradyrhizobium sp. JYMT SZCCT0428]MBR1156098.1 hypothetical protein [Bradyrhizobium sp. JYMT SZCCT0428]